MREAEVAGARVQAILQNAPVGLAIIGRNRVIQLTNAALQDMFGVAAHTLAGQPTPVLFGSGHQFDTIAARARPVIDAGGIFRQETLLPRRDGREFWCRMTGRMVNADDPALGDVWVFEDVSERRSYEDRIVHQATHDPLTGLPNRAFLMEWLRARLTAEARNHPLAVLSLDLDGFKLINDSLGHGFGDKLLVAMAARITENLGPGEFVARLGGDEFIVVADGCAEAGILDRARRLEAAIERPFLVQGTELRVTASVGVARYNADDGDAESLLRDADLALTHARELGPARTELFDEHLRSDIVLRHRLQSDLPQAIAAGDIFLVYQPIVSLRESRIVGLEALARWRHPDLGLINPATFIPVAEETGQILPLGRYILETAVTNAARWRTMLAEGRTLPVNVNFSVRQLWDERYVNDVLDFLKDGHAANLKIEVTESLTMANPSVALDVLHRFRSLGISLCMDDFGTGYSSLSHLSRFPFTVLKIDKSFVATLPQDAGQCALVRGIVSLAHDLGLEVVAEGIETDAQRRILQDIGCDYGQGYLYSPPVAQDQVDALLRKERLGADAQTLPA